MLEFETYYHIYNHANGNENLFREERNYQFFLEKYHQHIDLIGETVAWCLMPNHFHLLIKIKSEVEIFDSLKAFPKFQTLEKLDLEKVNLILKTKMKILETYQKDKNKFLSKQFSNFFSSYTQAYNKVYNRKGSLFLKNFKRKEIKAEDYFSKLIIYIHRNPVSHGFVEEIEDWKWTSFLEFPVRQHEFFKMIFGDEKNYQFVHQLDADEEIKF